MLRHPALSLVRAAQCRVHPWWRRATKILGCVGAPRTVCRRPGLLTPLTDTSKLCSGKSEPTKKPPQKQVLMTLFDSHSFATLTTSQLKLSRTSERKHPYHKKTANSALQVAGRLIQTLVSVIAPRASLLTLTLPSSIQDRERFRAGIRVPSPIPLRPAVPSKHISLHGARVKPHRLTSAGVHQHHTAIRPTI